MKKTKNNFKGITLVALVITIILLLILAGISISALTNTGIFARAQKAREKSKDAEQEQVKTLGSYEKELNKYIAEELTNNNINVVLNKDENTVLKDTNGNVFTVPAGFKIVVNEDTSNAKTVDKGIVIEDATSRATAGSQFVWVPVGKIKKEDGTTVEINLNRYTFDSEGKPTVQNEDVVETYFQELASSNKGNTAAKSITRFKTSVLTNGGYYIGRYEARTTTKRTFWGSSITQITEKGMDQIYNFVSQSRAAQLSQNMYNVNKYTSDLINSYAWDTTILFLQSCGTNSKYSRQKSLNTSLLQTGTNILTDVAKIDKECNIFDMAGNIHEWTTETAINSSAPCVFRGGSFYYKEFVMSSRHNLAPSDIVERIGFRPILYINN